MTSLVVILSALSLMFASADAVADPGPVPGSQNLTDADVGNWTVGDCLLAQFGMEFTLRPDLSDVNATLVVKVDPYAKVNQDQSNCGKDEQLLRLKWTQKESNSTRMLHNNMTLTFKRENNTLYGVRRMYGYFEIATFNYSDDGGNTSSLASTWVAVDSTDMVPLMFPVPFKRSYLCSDLGDWTLTAQSYHSFDPIHFYTTLPNATIASRNVQFDAFRTKDSPKNVFRSPVDCDYMPNDIVPIVVGVILAVVVLFVIAAYIYGRRRFRQSSYDQV